jgi:hypothetical protein
MGMIILAWYNRIYDEDARSGDSTDSARRWALKYGQHFLADFMHRKHLSYRGIRTTRRCGVRLDEVTLSEEKLSTIYRDLSKTHIVNDDESMCLLYWQPRKTVDDTRVEAVTIEIDRDSKAGFTLIGSIAPNGDTLSLFLVA